MTGTQREDMRPGVVKTRLAAETLRLYAGDWARFSHYCLERRQVALPAQIETVMGFLATPGLGRAALARRLAAIDHYHRTSGAPPPGESQAVRAALKRARRQAPRPTRLPQPTPAQLRQFAAACTGDLAGRRDRALLLLAAAGLGRRALVSLNAEQIRFSQEGLTLRPTARDGGDAPEVLVPASSPPPLCPARAVDDWLRTSGTRFGPVFRKVDRWGNVEHTALGADAIRRILAKRAGAARMAPGAA